MTGELTLSGRVLPVGGIKEKILAARRAGVKTVVLPKKNEENLKDIPDYIKREMSLVLVEHIQEVFDLTFPPKKFGVMSSAFGDSSVRRSVVDN